MYILNLTRNSATEKQLAAGVVDITSTHDAVRVKRSLTFTELPTQQQLIQIAKVLTEVANSYNAKTVLISGPVLLMDILEAELKLAGISAIRS